MKEQMTQNSQYYTEEKELNQRTDMTQLQDLL